MSPANSLSSCWMLFVTLWKSELRGFEESPESDVLKRLVPIRDVLS
jgi:hypothetical protein